MFILMSQTDGLSVEVNQHPPDPPQEDFSLTSDPHMTMSPLTFHMKILNYKGLQPTIIYMIN